MKLSIAVLALAISACSTVEQHVVANRPANVAAFASIGDVMLRVDIREDLPNAWGAADIFGRKRELGFSELRYMGLSTEGSAVFRRRDVDIVTNETTMTRAGVGTAVVTAQPAGQGVVATSVTTQAPPPNVQALPPDTTQFVLNLTQSRVITMREQTIEIIEATPSGVRFVVK